MSSSVNSSTGFQNITVPGVRVERVPPSVGVAADNLYLSGQKGSEAKPQAVTLGDMKRLVKKLVPAIFSMKTRSGPVVPQLRNLLRRMQTLHNAKILADENLESARKAIQALEVGSKDFQETVRWLGTKLPPVIDGPVTITLPEADARYLFEMSRELVLVWGEKQLEQSSLRASANKNGDVFNRTVTDFGQRLRDLYGSMGVAPTAGRGNLLPEMHDALVAELKRQNFYAPRLELYMGSDRNVVEVRVPELLRGSSGAVLDKAALRAVFDRHLPSGVVVECPLL